MRRALRTVSRSQAILTWREPEPLPRGLDAATHELTGRWRRRSAVGARLRHLAGQADDRALDFRELRDHDLRVRLLEFREQFRRGGSEGESVLLPALAALREAADRTLGLRPFVVQLQGVLALHRGYLAEMATGEGKTLTAALAAVLSGWTRRPLHILTVNDYLVERDARWLAPLYEFAAVSVGTVTGAMRPPDRRRGHAADITYTTGKELLADFLRDRLALAGTVNRHQRLIHSLRSPGESARREEQLVLRGLHSAIVDEADSILIDEAVTPLIISMPRPNEALCESARQAEKLAAELVAGTDYTVDARHREVRLTRDGEAHLAESCRDQVGLWRGAARREELIRQALTAREFFLRGKQYVVDGEKVVIVDEFTGRPMPQRSWRQGLHQAIEAKERVPLSDPAETIARMSFQKFFRCFHRLSGMTGTARESAGELWGLYQLPMVPILLNRPCIRALWPDQYFATESEKWSAIVDSIVQIHASGRPILAGTRSVHASEHLAGQLEKRGLEARVLNATRLADEAMIVAMAGEPSRITIATNMAGRGTDIRLGAGVAERGGLHVIATERHESGRVDRQLIGRAGRQGDPGSAQQFASAEDELVVRFLPAAMRSAFTRSPRQWGSILIRRAQAQAQRLAVRQRQSVLRADTWLDESLAFVPE